MAYCTEAQVEALYAIAIATTAGTDGKTLLLTADQLTAQIANADAFIDSRLFSVAGITLPLTTVPATVMEISRMLAGANALDAAGIPQVTEDGSTGLARGYRDRAMEMLAQMVANPAGITAAVAATRYAYDIDLDDDRVDFETPAKSYLETR
jgi:hypothetical protein